MRLRITKISLRKAKIPKIFAPAAQKNPARYARRTSGTHPPPPKSSIPVGREPPCRPRVQAPTSLHTELELEGDSVAVPRAPTAPLRCAALLLLQRLPAGPS